MPIGYIFRISILDDDIQFSCNNANITIHRLVYTSLFYIYKKFNIITRMKYF